MKDFDASGIFSEWKPLEYLQEYFPAGVDNEPAVRFIIEERSKANIDSVVLDVGCGPSICYWEAISPISSKIILSDFLQANLREQQRWVNKEPDLYDWSSYTELILDYEGKQNITPEEITKRENDARMKIAGYEHCDISMANPLGISHRNKYDCVISICCADSITYEKQKWKEYMNNIFSLLKPGGLFIGSSMRNCTHYKIGNNVFPAANLNENDFATLFRENGFDYVRIEVTNESQPIINAGSGKKVLRSEYDEVILASGRLRKLR